MITDIKYLESQFSDELAEELNKSDEENSTNVDAIIAEIMCREGTAFTNAFDIGSALISETFALQEKGDNINYEHPMGHKYVTSDRAVGEVEILSGDAIDVEVKNTLETFDAKKNKLLLESKNIVRDYNDFVQCHFEKNITGRSGENGTPSYAKYFKCFSNYISIAAIKNGISDDDLRGYIAGEYHQMNYPDRIRQVVQMRIKYIEGVNAILREMIKTNGQLLGINEQQIDALIKGLSNDETSGKTVGKIKDIIVANKEKFIKQNGTILDLRPLGAGVFIGSDDDDDHKIDKDDDKLKTVIQRCLTYDLILNAHGGTYHGEDDLVIYNDDHAIDVCTKKIMKILPRHGLLGQKMRENPNCESYIKELSKRLIWDDGTYMDPAKFSGEASSYIRKEIAWRFDLSDEEVYTKFKKNLDALIKDIHLIYKGLVKNNDGDTYFASYVEHDRKQKCKNGGWHFRIRYLDGKEYNSVKEVIKMAKSKGFDKILIYTCNPGGRHLPKDLTKNVTFASHSIWKETFIDDNYIDYYNESVTEDDIYEFLNDFENDYRAIAESYNIDYDNDQVLNEMYNYVTSDQYIAEMSIINEGKLSDIWRKIIEFIKKAIGFIISLVKAFIKWIKGIIDKIKERFSKKKKVKINKSKIKASFVSVEGDNASLTSEKEVSSYDELKELINKVMEAITKVFRKNSDEQARLQNSLKNECERAANKQSSIGEGYLGLYESTRVKSLINKNSNTMQQITSIIIPISNKVVNKRFNSVGNASVSNTMKKYSKSTNSMLNSNFSDINTIKAEYNLPKDKEVFSKMGKEYQWNEDFSNELDKLTESIKRMPKIKEICSNVTWETHPNKFCLCFHIKKQLLDYSSND